MKSEKSNNGMIKNNHSNNNPDPDPEREKNTDTEDRVVLFTRLSRDEQALKFTDREGKKSELSNIWKGYDKRFSTK